MAKSSRHPPFHIDLAHTALDGFMVACLQYLEQIAGSKLKSAK